MDRGAWQATCKEDSVVCETQPKPSPASQTQTPKLLPERVCYQEGCVARGWGFRVEGGGMGLAGPGESWATLGKWKGAR